MYCIFKAGVLHRTGEWTESDMKGKEQGVGERMKEPEEEIIAKLGSLEYLSSTPKSEVDALRAKWHAHIEESQRPLLAALAQYGVEAKDIHSVSGPESEKAEVVELLLEHMTRGHPAPVRNGIAAAIRGPVAAGYWHVLRELYMGEKNPSVKQALAIAFGEAAVMAGRADEISAVIESTHDDSRALLLRYLLVDAKSGEEAEARLSRFASVSGLDREVRRLSRKWGKKK